MNNASNTNKIRCAGDPRALAPKTRRADRIGFTLIEVMLAGAILAVGCIGVLGMMLAVINQNNISQRRTEAMYLAEILLERLEIQAVNQPSAYPWATIKNASGQKWTLFAQNNASAICYDAKGHTYADADCNAKTYRAQYMTLASNDAYKDYVRGALRVVWTPPDARGNCAIDSDGKTNDFCDSVSLPFAFRKTAEDETAK